MSKAPRDRKIVERIAQWFDDHARDFPWRRRGLRNGYHALVSEAMLQQTQASRVIEKFDAFIKRFPTVGALARADEEEVLAVWSGLGYYRRARHLHQAAKMIVDRFHGEAPGDVEALRLLPGVGRYTAGAIASLVFNQPEPIVDGNVARVLLRLEGETFEPSSRDGSNWLWRRSGMLVEQAALRQRVGAARFNEGLMELGALVCKPVGPRCVSCPVASLCRARRLGLTDAIPTPRPAAPRRTVYHACVIIEGKSGARLVTRRDDEGLWAGLWQPPTLERADRAPSRRQIEHWLGGAAQRVVRFDHLTTHRLVRFAVWRADSPRNTPAGVWRSRGRIASLALSSPHRRILLEL